MPRLEELPPDLRATLSLLVDRGKSYAQVAELLSIPESAVRDRAHAALDALAGTPGRSPDLSPPSPAAATPSARRTSPASTGSSSPDRSNARSAGLVGSSDAVLGLPVSKRGGALLLAGIVVVVVVAVVLLTSGGGGSSTSPGTSAAANTSTTTHTKSGTSSTSKSSTKSTGSKASVTNQVTLLPPDSTSKSIGIAEVLVEGSQHAVYVAAEHLPPTHGFFYVLWLANSSSGRDQAIGKTTVGSTGRLQAGALLPANAGDYHQILLARETDEHSTTPGSTVLSGAFSLNK